MKMKIYDYANEIKEIELPDGSVIEYILVVVLSGDETGRVSFTNGDTINFDASDCRYTESYDGAYIVNGDNIQRWLNWEPAPGRTYSYARQAKFDC